jgi:hypothetical protein
MERGRVFFLAFRTTDDEKGTRFEIFGLHSAQGFDFGRVFPKDNPVFDGNDLAVIRLDYFRLVRPVQIKLVLHGHTSFTKTSFMV